MPDIKQVRFVKLWSPYNAGETAGFTANELKYVPESSYVRLDGQGNEIKPEPPKKATKKKKNYGGKK